MRTVLLRSDQLADAARFLQAGECVAFPTETVYGLGANALDEAAVRAIFKAKGRPQDNPLIVHCHSHSQVADLVTMIPHQARGLMEKFWPGPLTVVLPKQAIVPAVVSAGLDTVAVRIPNHPVALSLLRRVDLPVAAPSANASGRPSPTRAEHVMADLGGRIRAIVDGGATGWGVESTVVDCTTQPFRLLRPGGITLEQLESVCPIVVDPGVFGQVTERPRSPGMKYKHYAPNAQVIVVVGQKAPREIRRLGADYRARGLAVGIMALTEHLRLYEDFTVFDMGSLHSLKEVSARLYHTLRAADLAGMDVVVAEGVPTSGLGMAIMNRLRKAAGDTMITT